MKPLILTLIVYQCFTKRIGFGLVACGCLRVSHLLMNFGTVAIENRLLWLSKVQNVSNIGRTNNAHDHRERRELVDLFIR